MMLTDTDPFADDPDRLLTLITDISAGELDREEIVKRVLPELLRISGRTLLRLRRSAPRFCESEWMWLSGVRPEHLSRKDANKFLCACILEIHAGKTDVWDNVAFFTGEILSDPEYLWREITVHTPEGWNDLYNEYNLHPEFVVHTRLYQVALLLVRYYQGDARQIWSGFEENPAEVFKRLKVLGVPRSTACLVIGALKDEGYLAGAYDIVGDVVDSRVIGRLALGESSGLSSYQARSLARMIYPPDPWMLDRPLYVLGMSACAPGPRCRVCPAKGGCVYAVSLHLGARVGNSIFEEIFGQKTVQKSLKRWIG
ncbi:MAG TPA: hypothetical protein VN372_04855 [Methanospirillum sp.]|nr:hypothetical protein [Methanospirillum sp.]